MLRKRVAAALVFAPALLWIVYVGGRWLEGTCVVLALLVLWEYLRLCLSEESRAGHVMAYCLTAGIASFVVGWLPAEAGVFLLPALPLAVLLHGLGWAGDLHMSMQRASALALGALYGGALLPFLARLRNLPQGLSLSLMALFCTWGADTGAYFAGRYFGRHKLYPKISPGKTVEGVIGGVASAVAVALLIRAVLGVDLATGHVAVLGALAACVGTLGDLSESMLKRSVGAKDSSGLIPGHGGVLDRFDAVMFVAPSFFAYLAAAKALGVGPSLP